MYRRRNILWGLIAVGAAAILLLRTLGVLPAGLDDLFSRAWAVLLVVIGLAILLRNRLPAGGLLAVFISAALVGGIAFAAYNGRVGQVRDDYRVPVAQSIGTGVSLLQVNLELLTTDVEIALSGSNRTLGGEFAGSLQSLVEVDYNEDRSGLGTLTLRESKPEAFPSLEAVGRGSLRIELPADVPLDVSLRLASGTATVNLNGTQLERLNLDVETGNALVTLPEYEPRSESVRSQPGTLTVRNGNITLFIPGDVAARLELERGNSGIDPQFDSTVYDYVGNVLLEDRNFANADIVIRYVVVAPRGLIRVENTP